MARVAINTGSTANDGTGDTLRAAGGIINSNFSDIYNYFGDGTNLSFSGGNFVVTAAGINTLSNVGIGTTNPRFDLEVGAVGASGTSLWVNGNARVTGILTVGTASIVLDGASNIITVGSGVTINGSGVISATQFSGDGSGLTGVTAVGSGVAIQDSGASVGAAATIINFADNLTVSSSSAGIVTVTSSGGGGTGYWEQNATGINTTSNVGIGTTTASSPLTVKGNTSLETLNVSGVSTFNSTLNGVYLNNAANVKGTSNIAIGQDALLNHTSGNNSIAIGWRSLYNASNSNFSNLGIGYMSGYTLSNGVLNTFLGYRSGYDMTGGSGNVIIGSFDGDSYDLDIRDSDNYIVLSSNGQSSTAPRLIIDDTGNTGIGTTNPKAKLDVGGTLSASAVNVVGTTTTGQLNVTGVSTLGVTSATNLNAQQLNVSGVSTFQAANNSYVEMGNPSYYAGLRLISGATEARVLQSGAGDLYLTSQSNRNISLNTYAMFGDTNNFGNVQLNNGNTGNTKVGSGITFTSSTKSIYVEGTTITNQLSVSGVSTLGTVQVSSGIVNAASGIVTYYGDASNAADGRWTLGASGTDHYVFSGIGITGGLQNDPTLHLQRGRVYEFVNEMGAHPFQIQQEYQNTSGQPYEVGVTNNGVTNGTLRWEVPFNAPNTLYYQCTSHVGMSGTIHITPSGYDEPIGFRTTRTVTTSSLGAGSSESVSIQGFKTYALLKVDIGNAAWVTLYTDSASRTADASARTHLQDPEPGSGVIAEVYTESTGSSSFKMSPGVIGWNNDSPTGNTIYLRVLNNESTSTAIGVTVTLVKMED